MKSLSYAYVTTYCMGGTCLSINFYCLINGMYDETSIYYKTMTNVSNIYNINYVVLN